MTEVSHRPTWRNKTRRGAGFLLLAAIHLALPVACAESPDPESGREGVIAKVSGDVQIEPGGERHLTEVEVVGVPENPLTVPAGELDLPDQDLVLGVVIDGRARAYPIRYLALSEIVDDWIGDTPVAPTW